MPSRCCIQYVSKSGRSSSGHRTWEFPKKDSTLMVIPLVGRTDTEAETSVFWSSNANSWLTGKVPDAGKDWRQQEKRASEDDLQIILHQFPRRVVLKDVLTIRQLHSSPMLLRQCLKSCMLGQHYENQELLDVQAGFREEKQPEIKLPAFTGS